MGITPNLQGFRYICSAVNYISANKFIRTIDLYETIAHDAGTNYKAVERSIRHAVKKADKDSETWKKYIGLSKYTNSSVLYTLTLNIEEEYKNEQKCN